MTTEEKDNLQSVCEAKQQLLKACPFCGGHAEIKNTWTIAYWVECTQCDAQVSDPKGEGREGSYGEHTQSIERAVKAWQHRASFEIEEVFNDIVKWQRKTFETSTALSKTIHLYEEVKELGKSITNNEENFKAELADCFILLFGIADISNMTFKETIFCITEKMQINKQRNWLPPDESGVVKHIKD